MDPPDADFERLVNLLREERKSGLSVGNHYVLDNGTVNESRCSVPFLDYSSVISAICERDHNKSCEKCWMLVSSCTKLLQSRVMPMADVWNWVNSENQYTSDKARRLFLQGPFALITVGQPSSGLAQVYVCPKASKDTYNLLCNTLLKFKSKRKGFSQAELLKDLLMIAASEPEKERMKYLATSISNSSRREASKVFGVSMGRGNSRGAKVADAVQQCKLLHTLHEELMVGELQARLGKDDNIQLSGESDSSEVSDDDNENPMRQDSEDEFDSEEVFKLKTIEAHEFESSEDDSEDVDEDIIRKRIIDKWKLRTRVGLAKLRLMRGKVTKQEREITRRHPKIGQVIEERAKACDVGADQWRRSAHLTFIADKKIEKRLTYRRLQTYLQDFYKEKISIGTVVELTAKRHKRWRSSQRYKEAAQLRFRKATKGFNLKLQPDDHWSRSMYCQLEMLVKGANKSIWFGRDDQAGIRCDTTYTHKQQGSLSVTNTVTTRTDFLNKNATVLQITSYNFPETDDYPEVCVGVVKAHLVHGKNPSQHMADLMMLEKKEELAMLFNNTDKEYVCVDGASDEGPSHVEVQFIWTERHLVRGTKLMAVTSRCSGDSYLNRVELQNGQLAMGHGNTHIPSTLNGEPLDDNGKNVVKNPNTSI